MAPGLELCIPQGCVCVSAVPWHKLAWERADFAQRAALWLLETNGKQTLFCLGSGGAKGRVMALELEDSSSNSDVVTRWALVSLRSGIAHPCTQRCPGGQTTSMHFAEWVQTPSATSSRVTLGKLQWFFPPMD